MPAALSSAAKILLVSLTLPCIITIVAVPASMVRAVSPTTSPQPTQTLNSKETSETLAEDLEAAWRKHRLPLIGFSLLLGGSLVAYVGVFSFRPLLLLKIPSADISVPWTIWRVPLGLVRLLKYRNRVLDTWVEQHWQVAQEEFLTLETVKERRIHILLPVHLNGEVLKEEINGRHLASTFQKKTAVLLILGEGGAGKTSLTCKIALWGLDKQLSTHRMLPVLVETELDEKRSLLEVIRGQLNTLTNQSDPIATELLEMLLHRQRILVIVDHLSEMSENTRRQITPDLADFPAKALIVTSRIEKPLETVSKTVLKPLQIEPDRLWPFMSAYLDAIHKQDLFVDDEYSDACDRLRRIAGERNITVLLARLYIDHLIREREGAGGVLPDSVPKLMLSYLNSLNQNVDPSRKKDDLIVQRAAQVIAWESLRKAYRPQWIKKEDAISALANEWFNTESESLVAYLEDPLQLLLTPQPKVETRIILDPLAEYLAAIYQVERHCCQKKPEFSWRNFFQAIDRKMKQPDETPEAMRGFLLAVWDCCEDRTRGEIPSFVTTELDAKAGVNRKELQRVQANRRIRKLISELSAPELKYRINAAEDLANRGVAARVAHPNLIGMLQNRNQEIEARQAAALALGNLHIGEEVLLKILTDTSEEKSVRRSVAESLGFMQAGQLELLNTLEDYDQPLLVRQGAARALSMIGSPEGEPVQTLIIELKAGQAVSKIQSTLIRKEILKGIISLDLVSIPEGKFLMGSPPDEVDRNWYQTYYPETNGLDVEGPQRPVKVNCFWMSQYPITQSQWRIVADLPRLERDLVPSPANFKGDSRPVELVSWDEAMEFCARLSSHTGKTYRLPTEAEWEYACRAKTITPFHYGEALDPELANYNGNFIYKNGLTGRYRQETTNVGSFGVANAFGLSDLHGNVSEWCLDHWHPTYERAPTDASAWLVDGYEKYRVARGGSWNNYPSHCRSAARHRYYPDYRNNNVGFRVVCVSS